MCIVWCEVECRRNVEMVCWDVVEWFDVNYGAMWNVVRSVCEIWCNVECCNFRHDVMWNAIEMQTVWCGIWRGVDCGVLVCGMLHNARCGTLRWDVKCGCVELWWWRMWHMQCAVRLLCDDCCVMTDVEIRCNVLWCQMWCDVKSRCGCVMWCGIWCGVKCAVMLNVGMMWNSCGCGMVWDVDCGCVMWNMLCFEMWWCGMVVGSRLWCNAMSDVEYGGPRWDVTTLKLMSVRCGVEHVVCSNVMWNFVQWWCDVEWCDVAGMVWCGMVWRERWCDVKSLGVMRWNDVWCENV